MGKGHEPYSEFCAERLFEKTEEERLTEALNEIIKNDPEHAAEIITRRLEHFLKTERKEAKRKQKKAEESLRQERQLKEDALHRAEEALRRAEEVSRERRTLVRKNRKRKNRSILIFVWLSMAALLTLAFEYLLPQWGMAIVLEGGGVLMAGGMLLELIKIIVDGYVNGSDAAADGSGEEPGGMMDYLKKYGRGLKKKGVLQMTAFGLSLCLAAGVLAKLEVCEGIVLFCRAGSVMLADARGLGDKIPGEIPQQQGEPEATISYETRQYLTGADEELIRLLTRTQVSGRDLDMLLKLSPEDCDAMLFYGESGIGESLSQERMNERILEKVNALLGKKLENVFDRSAEEGGPPQSIRDEISRVSGAEETAAEFSEIKDILSYRENINETYPKRTLTQLVSNGYHHLALLLYWNGGREETIAYYYGQSILYGLKCLEYADNTGLTVKEKLLFIARRYEDINYTCPGFGDRQRAGMLAAAFRYASDQY